MEEIKATEEIKITEEVETTGIIPNPISKKRLPSFITLVVSLVLSAILILSGVITLVVAKAIENATADKVITVTFNYNYGDAINSEVELKDGDLLNRPNNPSRTGYVFTGWYKNGALYSFTGEISSNMTLYAGWKQMQQNDAYSKTEIKPYQYSSSYNSYSISTSGTSSSSKKYIYLVANESGYHYIYYKNASSSYDETFAFKIENITTWSTIKSTTSVDESYFTYVGFNCNVGDVIVISVYKDYYYSTTASFYFEDFEQTPISSARARI
jgi:uncharacterized repeat protein (TIGR02543 family)